MPRTGPTKKKRRAPALGPGLHLGTVELRGRGSVRVRLMQGEVVSADVDPSIDAELVRECQRDGTRVVLCAGPTGKAIIVGALVTAPAAVRRREGKLSLEAKEIRLKASDTIAIDTKESSLRLSKDGKLRIEGDRLEIDVGSLVRFLAARVEFP